MKTKSAVLFCLIVAALLVPALVSAQEVDVEGSQDHPLISRFPGSVIAGYDQRDYDEYTLPLGPLDGSKDWKQFTESLHLEGEITRILYHEIPRSKSTMEVLRNYQLALKKAGFEILYEGTGVEGLGYGWPGKMYKDINPLREGYSQGPTFLWSETPDRGRYVSAKLARPEGDVYVSLFVQPPGDEYPKLVAQLDIIEIQPMETGLITVTAKALATDIKRTGHVAVYGILFDTGKSELKPESGSVLKEIGKLLQENPDLKLYVVGHTDNVGDLESNMTLSQDRAAAVVAALVSDHGVDVSRLTAHGVGPLAPVASNATDEGRARNRRVELVGQ